MKIVESCCKYCLYSVKRTKKWFSNQQGTKILICVNPLSHERLLSDVEPWREADTIVFFVFAKALADLWLARKFRKLFWSLNENTVFVILIQVLILNPWQASQSIPIEVVYEKEGFLYKKEGVSIVMRQGNTASSVLVLRYSLVWKGLASDISGTQSCANISVTFSRCQFYDPCQSTPSLIIVLMGSCYLPSSVLQS